jgi:hypothetical protein
MRDMVRSLKRQLVLALEREATEKARADKAEEEIERWQASSMLENAAGDPEGITPDDNEKNVCALMADLAKAERLRDFAEKLQDELRARLAEEPAAPDQRQARIIEVRPDPDVPGLAATEKRRGDDEALMQQAAWAANRAIGRLDYGGCEDVKEALLSLADALRVRLGEEPAAPGKESDNE